MKRLITLCFFANLFFSNLSATHITGGDLTYRYIGDSTGFPFHYEVQLRLLRDKSGIQYPSTLSITVSSSCFSSQNRSLYRTRIVNQTISGVCLDPNTIDTNRIETHIYKSTFYLPGLCSNYTLIYNSCCRNPSINLPPNSSFEIRAALNNTLGPVNSIEFGEEAELWGCIGRENEWPMSFNKRSNDSILFSFTPIMVSNGVSISYQNGFSWLDPISVNQGTFSYIDPQTALLTYEPDIIQYSMVAVKATQLRLDSLLNNYVEVSTVTKEFPVIVFGACNTVVPFTSVSLNSVECKDSSLTLNFDIPILKSSISQNEFLLFGPDNHLIPIVQIAYGPNQFTSTFHDLVFHFDFPIFLNGEYNLLTRIGNNGNFLKSICGEELPSGDSITFTISSGNCDNIKVNEYSQDDFKIYPNPAHDFIILENTKQISSIIILSIDGKVIHIEYIDDASSKIDTHYLTNGMYFLMAKFNNGEIKTFKISKI